MEIEELIEFGMTKTEARVYLEIVKLGETQIGPIIKMTGLHRGTVYNSISSLIEKGFLSFVNKEDSRLYRISGKKIFEEITQEKQKKASLDEKRISEFFENLDKIKEGKYDQDVSLFYGINAFKSLFMEIYDECKKNNSEYLFQGKGGEMARATGDEFYNYTQKLKKKMKIKCRIILDIESKNSAYRKSTLGTIKYLPSKIQNPVNFWIYNDVVLIVLFGSKPLTSIKIKSQMLADSFKSYFENLWRISESDKKYFEKRSQVNLYDFVLDTEESLDMMGLCLIVPLHEARERILELLKLGKRVRILLSHPESKEFKKRVLTEERFIKSVNESRILYESKASIANLKDIRERFKKCDLEVRFFDKPAIYSITIVDNKKILFNYYGKKIGKYGSENEAWVLEKGKKKFEKAKRIFEEYWESAKPLKL